VTAERYRTVRKVAARVIDGKAVMITLSDSRLHRLNASATRVWEGIESGRTVSEIVAGLCEEFAVLPEQAHADVKALLGELLARGIVAPAGDEAAEASGR
jgi:hypothetical protein